MTDFYALSVKTIDGETTTLAKYRGRVLLIVNVASKCGFTKQYAGLQKLFKEYEPRGLTVLGFPSNDFGAQEPGADSAIKTFCSTNFGVTFPLFAKGPVTGSSAQPVFKFLTSAGPTHGPVAWNFEKFLVAADGRVIARFESGVEPGDPQLSSAIETELTKAKSLVTF